MDRSAAADRWEECGECGAHLDPTWKFCVFCGTRVVALEVPALAPGPAPASASASASAPALAPAPVMLGPFLPKPATAIPAAIPAAIRPQLDPVMLDPFPLSDDDGAHDLASRPKFDFPLVLGIAIGIFGTSAMVVAFVILVGSR